MAEKTYYVSEGKSLVTNIGIRSSGDVIQADMVGGDATLKNLAASKKGLITTEIPERVKKAKAEADAKAKAEADAKAKDKK